jgi:trigger factor
MMKALKILVALMALVLVLSCLSCTTPNGEQSKDPTEDTNPDTSTPGEGNDTTQTTEGDGVTLADFDPEKDYQLPDYSALNMADYVQLGRYKTMTVTIDRTSITVTDAQLENQIYALLQENHPDAKIKDRVTAWGDYVVMDYVGKLDGVAFGAGTALEQTIELSQTNGFIPGFVDGIVGRTPGVMAEVPVTFPEDYGNTDLAGKAVIFEMTVHYIIGNPELTDEFVSDYTDGVVTTAEEFRTNLREDMESEAYDAALESAMWAKIIDSSLVTKYHADSVMFYYSYYHMMYSQYATMYGMTLDNFLAAIGGSLADVFNQAKLLSKGDMVRYAVYADGGYSCSEEEYNAELDAYTKQNYAALRSSMIAEGEKDYTMEQARAFFHENYEEQLRDTCMSRNVFAALRGSITVNVNEPAEDNAQ